VSVLLDTGDSVKFFRRKFRGQRVKTRSHMHLLFNNNNNNNNNFIEVSRNLIADTIGLLIGLLITGLMGVSKFRIFLLRDLHNNCA